VRELPRQLTVDELAELFEGRTRLVERLAQVEDPLAHAREIARGLSDDEKKAVPPELAELNDRYEEKFGFRFVVFVNRRPKSEIVPILRDRLERSREDELETGVDELVQIAVDRWRRS
jgi:2-oxo-4-hydroxy-4-carboxy--5-ureidoimidazoline (OHCU) decarboxylase